MQPGCAERPGEAPSRDRRFDLYQVEGIRARTALASPPGEGFESFVVWLPEGSKVNALPARARALLFGSESD